MLRSFWFWLLVIIGAFVVWLARDQIAGYVARLDVDQPARTTNTQQLAQTLTPIVDGADDGVVRVQVSGSSSSGFVTTGATSSSSGTVNTMTYIVQSGDTLYSIARTHNVDVDTLVQINRIYDPASLQVNQELQVPVPTQQPTATRAALGVDVQRADVYVIQPGDTLSSIARDHTTSVAELQRLNSLDNPNTLSVGTLLLVPTPGVQSTPTFTPAAGATAGIPTADGSAPSPSTAGTPTPGDIERVTPFNLSASPPVPVNIPVTTPQVCSNGWQVALIWGAGFCAPLGWDAVERGLPDRAFALIKTESSGDVSVLAVVHPAGVPNAPLPWILRTAQGSLSGEIAQRSPGGVSEITWTQAQSLRVAGQYDALIVEGTTTYAATGTPAQIRLIVFLHQGERWTLFMIAPTDVWETYAGTFWPSFVQSIHVF